MDLLYDTSETIIHSAQFLKFFLQTLICLELFVVPRQCPLVNLWFVASTACSRPDAGKQCNYCVQGNKTCNEYSYSISFIIYLAKWKFLQQLASIKLANLKSRFGEYPKEPLAESMFSPIPLLNYISGNSWLGKPSKA